MSKSAKKIMVRVINSRMADGETFEEIIADYPKLTSEEIEELKHQIKDAIDKAIETYRKDYPNEKNYFSRKRVLT